MPAVETARMQFGRTYGVGLIILGFVLCGIQFVQYIAPTNSEHVISSLPGIIGAGLLAVGIALFITAHRRDEAGPK